MIDLSAIAFVDNHVHPLSVRQPETPAALRGAFSEAHDEEMAAGHVEWSLPYRWALRQLAAHLGIPATEEAILQRRSGEEFAAYARGLAGHAGIDWLLLDDGYPPPGIGYPMEDIGAMLGVRTGRIFRLETLLQELMPAHATLPDLIDAFDAALNAAWEGGCVALKSIAAYRTGLAIERPSTDAVEEALRRIAESLHGSATPIRLQSKPVIDFFLLRALRFAAERTWPVQLHTGYGDPDLDLRLANPLHLRPIFEDAELRGALIVLLHASYPFTAEAAYLATVYPNAYLDLPFCLPPLDRFELVRTVHIALGAAPGSKLLCSSDGVGIPEHYWLGAVRARECLTAVLTHLVDAGELDEGEASELGRMLLRDNAEKLYRLPPE
jgi:predicted TIM-barrel fold metal-dependent hydrolase